MTSRAVHKLHALSAYQQAEQLMEMSVTEIASVLPSFLEKGVRLWIENGRLNFRMPVGALTQLEVQRLRASQNHILPLLGRIGASQPPVSRVDCAPLTFSQLVHWELHRLKHQRSARAVASAVRLTGALNIGALKASIEAIVDRHEALRTCIATIGITPVQVIFGSVRSEFILDDLTISSRHVSERELHREIWNHVLRPIDVSKDILVSTVLLKLSNDEHVLIVAMDHMISDGMSMAILLDDLFSEYESETTGHHAPLPKISIQFADYAIWQRRMYRSWVYKHNQYWTNHLSAVTALQIADPGMLDDAVLPGLGFVPIRITSDLRIELVRWCRTAQTTLVMGVFTAFVALVLRWCRASEGIIQYQTSGRSMMEVRNTVGYLSFRLYLRLCVHKNDTFVDLLHRINAEYVTACEHAEFASMDVYGARPDVTRAPCFNWLAHDPMRTDIYYGGESGRIKRSRVPFEEEVTHLNDFRTDTELMVGLREEDGEIRGSVLFPSGKISVELAESFERNLMAFIRALLGTGGKVMQTELVA